MATAASIKLSVSDLSTRKDISYVRTIEVLISHGWTIEQNGEIRYLLLEDNKGFTWQSCPYNLESFLKRVQKKERMNEIIGVLMTWEDTGIGGSLFLWPQKKSAKDKIRACMSFSLTMNPQLLIDEGSFKVTDISWYIPKILEAFNQSDILVEAYEYAEVKPFEQ